MESEVSLPCSQKPATCPCLQPAESSIRLLILCVVRPTLILFFHLCPGFLSGFFFQFSPPKLCVHLCSPPYVLYDASSHLSWPGHNNKVWWKVQTRKLPIIKILSSPMIRPPSEDQIPSSAPCSQTSSACLLPVMWVTKIHANLKQHKIWF